MRGYPSGSVPSDDIRLDLVCGRGPDLRSWYSVYVRRATVERLSGDIVTSLPLRTLNSPDGRVPLGRRRSLSRSDVADLLRRGDVQFVVAAVGSRLAWIDVALTYRAWKQEIADHLEDPDHGRDQPPAVDCQRYAASLWSPDTTENPRNVVLLERRDAAPT